LEPFIDLFIENRFLKKEQRKSLRLLKSTNEAVDCADK